MRQPGEVVVGFLMLVENFYWKYGGCAMVADWPLLLLLFLGSGPVGDDDLWYHHILVTLCSFFLFGQRPRRGR